MTLNSWPSSPASIAKCWDYRPMPPHLSDISLWFDSCFPDDWRFSIFSVFTGYLCIFEHTYVRSSFFKLDFLNLFFNWVVFLVLCFLSSFISSFKSVTRYIISSVSSHPWSFLLASFEAQEFQILSRFFFKVIKCPKIRWWGWPHRSVHQYTQSQQTYKDLGHVKHTTTKCYLNIVWVGDPT